MVRKKNNRGENSSPRKLNNVRLKESARYSLETTVNDNFKKLQEYQTRRQNNEYITSDELATYRRARNDYANSTKRLNGIVRSRGGTIDEAAVKNNDEWLDMLSKDLSDTAQIMSGFDNAEDYGKAVKDAGYRDKYKGKSYSELMKYREIDTDAKKWIDQYAPSVMTAEDYSNKIANIDNEIAALNNVLNQYEEMSGRAKKVGYSDYSESWMRDFGAKYGSTKDIKAKLESLKAQKWDYENAIKFGSLSANEDYEAKSNFDPNLVPNMDGYYNSVVKEYKKRNGIESKSGVMVVGSDLEGNYDQLKDDEIKNFLYLYNTGRVKEAHEYMDSLAIELSRRQTEENSKKLKTFTEKVPVVSDISSVPLSLMGGAGAIDIALQKAIKDVTEARTGEYAGPVNYYNSAMGFSNASKTIRETRSQQLADKFGTIELDADKNPVLSRVLNGKSWGDVYQLGMSMADSAAVAVLAPYIGSGAATTLLAGNAASQGVVEAVERGANDEQALMMGALNGAFEWLFEKYEIDTLLGESDNVIKAVIKNALVEGFGETATSISNVVADSLVMANNSNLEKKISAYIEDGLSREEAENQALIDTAIEIGWDGVGGLLSGGIMGGGVSAVQSVSQNNYYKDIYGEDPGALVGEALELDSNYKYGQKMQKRLADGKALTGNQIGNVVRHNDSIIRENLVAEITDSLTELGEIQNVRAIAEAIAKRESGEKLTSSEERAISKSLYGEYVANKREADVDINTDTGAAITETTAQNKGSVLQSNARGEQKTTVAETVPLSDATKTELTKRINNRDVIATAKDAEGKAVGVIGFTDDGRLSTSAGVVDADTVTLDDPTLELIKENAKIYKGAEDLYLSAFAYTPSGVTTAKYEDAFNNIYTAGALLNMGIEFENLWTQRGDLLSGTIGEDVARIIFGAARNNAIARRNEISRKKDAEKRQNKPKQKKKGKVHIPFDDSTLTERQRVSVETVERIAEAIGAEVYFYASYLDENNVRVYKNAEGKIEKAPNGFYDPKDGSIHLDINAGDAGKSLILYTAAHELTHLIKDMSAVKFDTLADFLMEQYHKKGVDIAELIDAQIEKARENDRTIDYDTAYEEVVASSMETMLADGRLVEKLQELNKKDKNIVERIAEYFKELARKIRTVYEKMTPESREGQLVAEMVEETERLQDLFFDALKDVSETGVVVDKSSADSDVKFDSRNFSYSELVAKEDLRGVWIFPNEQPKIVNNIVDTNWVINEVRKNCETLSTNGGTVYYVNVPDIGRNVEIVGKGIRHSFDRPNDKRGGKSSPKALVNARVALKVPQILKNSIEVNRSKRGNNIDVPYTRVLVGSVALENNDGTIDYYAVRSMVEERTNQKSVLVEMNILGLLTSTNAKKIDSPTVRVDKNIVALADGGAFIYRISDLLDDVKGVLDNTFSDNVYNHFGIKRTNDDFSQYLLFSDRVSSRSMLVSALEGVVQTEEERAVLKNYKKDIEEIEGMETRLAELREEINDMQYSRGERSAAFLDELAEKREEARKITARLTRYDESILKLEGTQTLKTLISRERTAASRLQKQKEAKAKQRAARRREIAETRRKTLNIAYGIESLLSRETKNRNIKDGMKDVGRRLLSLSKFLFEDVYDNADIARLGIDGLDEDEKLMVARYVELSDRRDALKEEEKAIRVDDSVSREIRNERLEAFREEHRAEREAISKEISRFNNVELKEIFARERRILNKRSPEKVIEALEKAYRGLQDSESEHIKDVYSDLVLERITELKKDLKDVVAGEMTLNQTLRVYEVFKMVKHTITQADKLFADNKSRSLSETVDAVQSEISRYKSEDKRAADIISESFSRVNAFTWNNLKPAYAFSRLGSKTFERQFMNMAMADGVWAQDVDEAKDFIENAREKHGYDKWDKKSTKTFVMEDGRKFVLTLGNMQTVYALMKRDKGSENDNAMDHMRIGGFKFVKGAKFGRITQKAKDGLIAAIEKRTDREDPYRMTTELINEIVGSLTDEQKAYVDELQSYMSKDLAAKGNEVSMKLFGIELFKETNYMPIQSVSAYLNSIKDALNKTETMVSLKNTGMTKPLTPGANNPIVLREFEDVVFEHIDTMAKYHAYVLPIEDMQRIFNAAVYTDTNELKVTKAEIEKVFGGEARSYFENYIRDLNGGNRGNGMDSVSMALFSKMKKTAVAASLSVAIQQPFAITRAMAMIDPKYFVSRKGKTDTNLSVYKEMRKYAPITIVKEIGGYDMGSSRSAVEFMGKTKYGLEKAGAVIDDVSMKLPELMDRLGWSAIWSAVKNEIADTRSDLAVGSDEYFEECNRRFTEIITYTQVYDSVNSRSGLMRSKSELNKFATSFMGEPTTTINMLFDAWYNFVRAGKTGTRKEALGKLTRTVSVVAATSLLTKAAVSLVYALRDDDEDEGYWEKYMQSLGQQLRSELNPLNSIPYARDVMSIIEGWDVERPDLTIIADMVDVIRKLQKEAANDNVKPKTIWKLADTLGNACGLPIKNVRRDALALWSIVEHTTDGKGNSDVLKEFWGKFSANNLAEKDRTNVVVKMVEKERYKDAGEYVSNWVSDKALELAEKEGYNKKDVSGYIKAKYRKDAESVIRGYFNDKYKDEYLKSYKAGDVKGVKKIRVVLYNTGLYNVDEQFALWRKADFEAEYKEAYKIAYSNGDTKTMAKIEKKARDGEFYDKPSDTFKRWRKVVDELKG